MTPVFFERIQPITDIKTGPRLWNSLPTTITNSKSFRIFRKTLENSKLLFDLIIYLSA